MPYLIHKLLSYCKSHIYELHAILAAFISFGIMLGVKIPIKSMIASWVAKKADKNVKWKKNQKVYTRRANLILLVLSVGVSYAVFLIITAISPLIEYSKITAVLCAAFTLDIYAVFEQIFGKGTIRRGRYE